MSDIPANANKVNPPSHTDAPENKPLTIRFTMPAALHPSLRMSTAASVPPTVSPTKPGHVAPSSRPAEYHKAPRPPLQNDADSRPPVNRKTGHGQSAPRGNLSAGSSKAVAAREQVKDAPSELEDSELAAPRETGFGSRPLYTAHIPQLEPGEAVQIRRSEVHWRSANGQAHFTLSTSVGEPIPIDDLADEMPSTINRALAKAQQAKGRPLTTFQGDYDMTTKTFVPSDPEMDWATCGAELYDQRPSESGPQRTPVRSGRGFAPYPIQGPPVLTFRTPRGPPMLAPVLSRTMPPPVYAHPQSYGGYVHSPYAHDVHPHVGYPPYTMYPPPHPIRYAQRPPQAAEKYSGRTFECDDRFVYDAEGKPVAYAPQ